MFNRRTAATAICALFVSLGTVAAAAAAPVDPAAVPVPSQDAAVAHAFRFDAGDVRPRPATVFLVGSFNHFSRTDTPMVVDDNGVFTATLQLSPGVYHYKFLADGQRWFTDPTADKKLTDKADHGNSGVVIGDDAAALPPPMPNHIEPRGLAHAVNDDADSNMASATQLRLRVRTQADDVQAIGALSSSDHGQTWQRQPLGPGGRSMGFDYFGGVVNLSPAEAVDYVFELTDGSAVRYFAPGYLYASRQAAEAQPFHRSAIPTFETPDWAKHAVWYQIFPERFRNGDTSNDPPGIQRWTAKWYTTLPGEAPGANNVYKGEGNMFKRRYGGDIQGIRQELPYLRSLGVNALYLNPIFQADSLHKYDTRDYRHVDDHFGVAHSADELNETNDSATWKWSASDKLFLDFVADAHRQGFKVILDGVFNHVGRSHPFFQDVVRNGKDSKYAEWFVIYDFGHGGEVGKPGGLQYQGWNAKNGSLPIWKKDPKLGIVHGPREHLFDITRRWLAPDGDVSRGVDGFRLDAANEIPHPFWVDWRKLVKSINPDAYIDGEVWSWSQPWLYGDQFDAVMNYQFAMASQSFFVDEKTALTPSAFAGRLDQLFYNYPLQVVLVNQNLFDSHDTDRFASRFLNPDLGYNRGVRIQEPGNKYNISKPNAVDWARDRQAVAFQMAFAGAPMVYYGDEAGMWSPSDPSDRMPMWWKDLEPFDDRQFRFDQKLHDWYQRCIAVRNQLPALQTGSFNSIVTDDRRSVFAFAREAAGQAVYVVINRKNAGDTVRVPVAGDVLTNWLDDKQATLVPATGDNDRPTLRKIGDGYHVEHGSVTLQLPPFGAAILAAGGVGR